ncbi:MAG TPA: polyprenyl synthetase family protein [Gemmataceae bacterium]|nr:polyprenyl synthetase family protein [Gemmataceae bacterium]
MSDDLTQYLRQKRVLVERYLDAALKPTEGCPASLLEAMRYSLLAPGKRLRPLLVILSAEACGRGDPLPAGCAVEMIHAYSLIHDDLPAMDDDDLRRGQPTCHVKFGEALAILAGDALLTMSFQVLAVNYPAATAAACCLELARGAGAGGMVGGQVDDLAMEKKRTQYAVLSAQCGEASFDSPHSALGTEYSVLESLHARKTGALFRAALRMGVHVAQGERPGAARPEVLAALDAYGRCFGQAFQITDDLLDVEGCAEQTGKRVGKDAARGKLTYPGFLGIAESRRRAERLCEEACDHLAILGPAGGRLAALVQKVLERNH